MPIKWGLCFVVAFHTLWAAAISPSIQLRSEDWTPVFHQDGIVVEEQPIPGRPVKAYRAKGIIKAPIEQILEVLRDSATAAEWMPGLANHIVVDEVSDIELISLNVYAVPFPFADRELLLHSYLRLDPKRGALLAEAVSIDHPDVTIASGRVRAHMHLGKTWLRPLPAGRTEIEFAMLVEPRGRIPAFLTAFGLRRMPLKFIQALESRAQKTIYPLRAAYRDLLQQLAESGDGKASPHGQDHIMRSHRKGP